jgi:flagellar protein FlaG
MNTEINMPVLKALASTSERTEVVSSEKVSSTQPLQELKLLGSGNEEPRSDLLDVKEVENVVMDLNNLVQNLQRDLLFSVDEKSGDTFVKVLDKETEEVIREIPSKEIRQLKARLEETAGIIFKDSV